METQTATQEILAPELAPRPAQPLATVQPQALSAPTGSTPSDVIMYAMNRGVDPAQLERLLDLQFKWEANEARKAFVADMAEFKKNAPKITKDKQVGFESRGGSTSYKHATLGNVTDAIIEGLAKHGFSHNWEPEQSDGMIHITCVLTHRMGHSTRTTLKAGADQSGGKNSIQGIGSTITYLERYSLLAATGLATHDQDDDGAGAGQEQDLGEVWAAKAKAAPTRRDLDAVWLSGKAKIEERGTQQDMDVLQSACKARADEIAAQPGHQPNRSSRLSNIVNQGKEAPQ